MFVLNYLFINQIYLIEFIWIQTLMTECEELRTSVLDVILWKLEKYYNLMVFQIIWLSWVDFTINHKRIDKYN